MKILHTSDWHIGQELYKYDRSDEHKDFFRQLCGIVKDERPDVMVVCGDVFHQSNPSIAARELYTDALIDIHEAYPDMQIIVTAGNHDSSSRLEIERKLWKKFNVSVVGGVEKIDDKYVLEKFIQEIKDSDGTLKGYVIAVPFIHPNNFPALSEDLSAEERAKKFFAKLSELAAERNTENLPVVMTAHLAVSSKEDQTNMIAGMDYAEVSDFGEYYDYLALGHIHKPYTLNGGRVRYCGSPFATSFDDNSEHSVSIVEIGEHDAKPEVKTVKIGHYRPVVCKVFESLDDMRVYVDSINPDLRQYLLVDIKYSDSAVDYLAKDALAAKLQDTQTRFCDLRWINMTEKVEMQRSEFSLKDICENNPIKVARQFYMDKESVELPDFMEQLLQDVVREVEEYEKKN